MTTAVEMRPDPERDRWGRYVIPHPTTGKKTSWTRATTFSSSISDTFGLTKWGNRMVALGLAARSDLLAQVATVTDPDDKDAKRLLDGICNQAKEHAGASTRANLGTALHSFAEHVDAGHDITIPAPHDADIAAYRAAMDAAGITIDPTHIERIVTVPDYTVAGTFDRLVTMPDRRLLVADLKTGRDLSYSWTEIVIQLALYANAATIFDTGTGEHTPMPDVDKSQALVMHLPAGEATCTLYLIDIARGWETARLCDEVRTWRKAKKLAEELHCPTEASLIAQHGRPGKITPAAGSGSDTVAPVPVEPSPGLPVHVAAPLADALDEMHAKRCAWALERIANLKDDIHAKAIVRANWPAGATGKPPWSAGQLDVILFAISQAEKHIGAPFPSEDPAQPAPAPFAVEVDETAFAPDWPTPDDGPLVPQADYLPKYLADR